MTDITQAADFIPAGDLWDNPQGTDGFEFVEYSTPDPAAMAALFDSIEADQVRRGAL